MRVREKRLSVIVMNIALILLCLVLFTAHLSSGMFARYVTTAQGEAYSRTADYDVEITPVGSDTFVVTEKDSADNNRYGEAEYSFKITNKSEVPVRYRLDIALTVDQAIVNAYDFNGNGTSDIYERMIHNVRLADITAAASEPIFVMGSRGADDKYSFAGINDNAIVLERGESKTYKLMLDTDIVARYSDGEAGTGTAFWNRVSEVTGTKYHWDFEKVNIKYDITAKTVQID